MSGRNTRINLTAFLVTLLLAACAGGDGGERVCLGSGAACVGAGVGDSQSTVYVPPPEPALPSGQFTCSLVSDSIAVRSEEVYGVTATAQGDFTPPVNITQGLPTSVQPFYRALKIFGSRTNTGTTSVTKSGGVRMVDAENRVAVCNVTVRVLPKTNASNLACEITPSTDQPYPGQRVDFTFKGSGGNGTFTFTSFSPYEGTVVADSYIAKDSASGDGKAAYIYTTPAIRMASVIVKSGNDEAVCRRPLFVGVGSGGLPVGWDVRWDWSTLPPWWYGGGFWLPPPPPPPFFPAPQNTCDITLNPSPGLAGTLTNLRVTVPGYVGSGPFEITSVSSENLTTGLSSLLDADLQAIPRPSALERKIRYRDAGQHRLLVNYRSTTTGAVGSCQAIHVVRAGSQFITGTNTNTAPLNGTSPIRTFTGLSASIGPAFALPDTQHRGARVAMGDVNGDGFNDYIIAGGRDTVGTITYRVVIRSGANPDTVLYDFDPLPSHGGWGGAFVAAGDLNGDGKAEVIVGQDYPASWVKIYNFASGSPVLMRGMQPYGAVNYGVRVAMGDVNGDGYSDLLVVPGNLGYAKLKVYDGRQLASGTEHLLHEFHVLASDRNSISTAPYSGAFVAAGDVNGDGKADIIASLDEKYGADPRYKAEVWVYDGNTGALLSFQPTPFGSGFTGGVRVAAGDLDGNGRAEVLVAPGPGLPADGYTPVRALNFFTSQYLAVGAPFLEPYSSATTAYTQGFFIGAGTGGL